MPEFSWPIRVIKQIQKPIDDASRHNQLSTSLATFTTWPRFFSWIEQKTCLIQMLERTSGVGMAWSLLCQIFSSRALRTWRRRAACRSETNVKPSRASSFLVWHSKARHWRTPNLWQALGGYVQPVPQNFSMISLQYKESFEEKLLTYEYAITTGAIAKVRNWLELPRFSAGFVRSVFKHAEILTFKAPPLRKLKPVRSFGDVFWARTKR